MARPNPKHDIIQITLASIVGAGATITGSYPFGKSADDYLGGTDHFITSSTRNLYALSNEIVVTFGVSNITVVLTTNAALPAGAIIFLNIDRGGEDKHENLANPAKMGLLETVRVNLGVVTTAVANAVCATQALLAVNSGLINGAQALAGVATFAQARNVVAAWTGTAVLTVTGFDEYNNVMVESSGSGTTFTGLKAFARVTSVRVSADVTGLTVGNGVVLGLPVFLPDVSDALRENVDGVVPTAGVFVAGVRTSPPTATTGDVRGTWAPNAAPNAARDYQCSLLVRSTSFRGLPQFAG